MYTFDYFKNLWNAHFQWSTGVLYNKVIPTSTADIYFSEIPGESFNFALPLVDSPNLMDFAEINKVFEDCTKKPSFVLFSEHQSAGFAEYLIRKGYKSHGSECWVVLDKDQYMTSNLGVDIVEITPESFKDYYSVLSPVFYDFPGNDKYLEICLNTIKGNINSGCDDLVSKLYVIYDNGVPASGAGLFYSKKADAAYLHDGGTLKEYRGKGYQTALIKHRTNIALAAGISKIYSSVEPGSQSWSNCIKAGFSQTPWSLLMVKPE